MKVSKWPLIRAVVFFVCSASAAAYDFIWHPGWWVAWMWAATAAIWAVMAVVRFRYYTIDKAVSRFLVRLNDEAGGS